MRRELRSLICVNALLQLAPSLRGCGTGRRIHKGTSQQTGCCGTMHRIIRVSTLNHLLQKASFHLRSLW